MRPENKGFAKFIAIPALGLIGLAIAGCNGEPAPAANAAVAAEVGDTVTVRWPNSTVMCASEEDASKVYVTAEIAKRQAYRVENSASKAVEAERAARKTAMAQSACEWAPDKGSYLVKQKRIIGDEKALFHAVHYCLKPENKTGSACWWIATTATGNAPIIWAAAAPSNKI